MFDRIRTFLHRLHEVQEVNALSDRDFADLGLSRHQVLDFLRMPRDINERVIAMGKVFGVPEADLKRDYEQWVELLTICGHCTDRAICASTLASAHPLPSQCTFCGNRESFAHLAAPPH